MQNNKNIKHVSQVSGKPDRLNKSWVIKKALMAFLPVFFSVIAVTMVILAVYEKLEKDVYQKMEESIVDTKLDNIQSELLHITNDLMILALNSQMDKLWEEHTNSEVIKSLNEDFLNVAVYRKLYDQVRLIDENGMEVIRVNFNSGEPKIVPQKKLQNKKDRYYFFDAFKLNKGEIFVSPLDLNIEHGKIEQPLKPMIRVATPVFDRYGKKRGIVLLNYFGQTILNQLFNKEDPLINRQIMLLNSDGYWLKGTEPEYEWGFMYEGRKDITFANAYADAWINIVSEESSQFETHQGIFTFKTIRPLNEKHKTSTGSGEAFSSSKEQINSREYSWKIISYIPSEILYAKRNIRRKYISLILVVLSASLFFILWRLAKVQGLQLMAQQALKESEEKYRIVADHTSDWEYWVDNSGHFIYVSPSSEQISGYRPKDFYNDKNLIDKIVHPEDKELYENHKHHLDESSESTPIEFRIITRKNEVEWIGHVCQKVFGNDGNYLGVRGGNRLITKRKKAEANLYYSKEQLSLSHKKLLEERNIFMIGNVVVFKWKNKEGWPVEYVSQNAENVFGYTPEDFISGKVSFSALIHKEDLKRVGDEVKKAINNNSNYFCHREYRIINKLGKEVWLYDFTTILIKKRKE